MRYPLHLQLLDLFGFVALLSVLGFVFLPDAHRPPTHLDDFWGNVSTEMLGIWFGVRFIEWILNSHESKTKARVRIVRGMRILERLFHNVLEFRRSYELVLLDRDYDWTKKMLKSRRKYLSKDECAEVDVFYGIAEKLRALLPADAPPRSEIKISDEAEFFRLFLELHAARQKAEQNILDETDEDSGI
ncbi:MAG: hypothetical protein QM775_33135 [Pirellulales bacterium]